LVEHIAFQVVAVKAHVLLRIVEGHEALSSLLQEFIFDKGAFAEVFDPGESVASVAMEVPSIGGCGVIE